MRVVYHLPDDAADTIEDYQRLPVVNEILRTYRDLAGVTINEVVQGEVGDEFAVGPELLGLEPWKDADVLEAELNEAVVADGGDGDDEPHSPNGRLEVTDT